MKGKILHYSVENNLGYITSNDGKGYQFTSEDWKDSKILPKKNLLVDFEVEGNQAINILTISSEAKEQKDFFNHKMSLSWLELLVKISTIFNNILLFILLLFLAQTTQEIKSLKEKTSLFLQIFEQKTIPFFDRSHLANQIFVKSYGKDLDLPITIIDEEIEKDILKFLNISEQEIEEKQEERLDRTSEIEGKNAIATINRSQQAYHFEKQEFTDDIDSLGIVISTDYYDIEIIKDSDNKVVSTAIPKENNLKAYAGIIEFDQGSYNQLICESNNPSKSIEIPIDSNQCPNNSTEIK